MIDSVVNGRYNASSPISAGRVCGTHRIHLSQPLGREHEHQSPLQGIVPCCLDRSVGRPPDGHHIRRHGAVRHARPEDQAKTLVPILVTVERRGQDLQKYARTEQIVIQKDARLPGINNDLRNIQAMVSGKSMGKHEGNLEIFIRGVGSANSIEPAPPSVM